MDSEIAVMDEEDTKCLRSMGSQRVTDGRTIAGLDSLLATVKVELTGKTQVTGRIGEAEGRETEDGMVEGILAQWMKFGVNSRDGGGQAWCAAIHQGCKRVGHMTMGDELN